MQGCKHNLLNVDKREIMYSKDVRDRMSTYDRMRADQEKINVLTSKMRDMKQKLKNNPHGTPSTPSSPSRFTKRERSASPTRFPMDGVDLLDASAFR